LLKYLPLASFGHLKISGKTPIITANKGVRGFMAGNLLAMAIAGGILVLVGIGCIIWGSREAAQDYRILISHADVRTDAKKLVTNWRANSGAGSLIAGGIIAIVIGAALIGLMFYLIYRG
jgi:uncharacterized iron-regulated membrane protein